MVSKTVTVINAEGMHMRPAGMIAKVAKAHADSEIILKVGGKEIKATSIMQIMAAGIKKGTNIEIIVNHFCHTTLTEYHRNVNTLLFGSRFDDDVNSIFIFF